MHFVTQLTTIIARFRQVLFGFVEKGYRSELMVRYSNTVHTFSWDTFALEVALWLYDYFSLGVVIIHYHVACG